MLHNVLYVRYLAGYLIAYFDGIDGFDRSSCRLPWAMGRILWSLFLMSGCFASRAFMECLHAPPPSLSNQHGQLIWGTNGRGGAGEQGSADNLYRYRNATLLKSFTISVFIVISTMFK